jgi:hypothetical protein
LVVVLVTLSMSGIGCDVSDTLKNVADDIDNLANDLGGQHHHDVTLEDWWHDLWD